MNLPLRVAVSITLCAVSCRNPSENGAVTTPSEEPEVVRSETPIFVGNSEPTPYHTIFESSEIGSTLDDAVRVLGPWDQVGDVMEDSEGQFYPFSNRSGYDYIIRIGKDRMINGAWRRELKTAQNKKATPDKN